VTATRRYANTYPAWMVAEARRLKAAGWSLRRIAKIFEQRGCDPAPTQSTIYNWVRGYSATPKQREWQARRSAEASGGRILAAPSRPEFRLVRARALHRQGMPVEWVAAVMSFDYPDRPVTGPDIVRAFALEEWPS
jgi:hypothetical protein